MLVGEANAVYIFREKMEIKALKITEALIQAIQKLIFLIKISLRISP